MTIGRCRSWNRARRCASARSGSRRHVTAPPARYTEACLVRRLEELGIGRPSTWAAIVAVLQSRQYVPAGDGLQGTKPARMSVLWGMVADAIDLDAALALLALPREVGIHPETGAPILAGIGRYGPWLRHGHIYAAIPDDDVLSVGLNRAIHLIMEKELRESRSRGAKRMLRELGSHPHDGAPLRPADGGPAAKAATARPAAPCGSRRRAR